MPILLLGWAASKANNDPLWLFALFTHTRAAWNGQTVDVLAKWSLINVFQEGGAYADAAAMLKDIVNPCTQLLGNTNALTLGAKKSLFYMLYSLGCLEDARVLGEDVVALERDFFGAHHPETPSTMGILSTIYRFLERYDDAKRLKEEMLTLYEKALEAQHPRTLAGTVNLALSYYHRDVVDVIGVSKALTVIRDSVVGARHPETVHNMGILAVTLSQSRRHEEAKEIYEQALPTFKEVFGTRHQARIFLLVLSLISVDTRRLERCMSRFWLSAERCWEVRIIHRTSTSTCSIWH